MEANRTWQRGYSMKWLGLAGLTSMALLVPPLAQAEGYIGVGGGESKAKDIVALPGGSVDDTDTGWKVYGGYMFHPNVGLELSYVDLGKFTGSAPGVSVEAKPKTVDLSLIGVLPLPDRASPFSLFGKVGGNRWKVDTNTNLGSASDHGTDLSYGVGAQYDFARNWAGRLEWNRFRDVGDPNTTGRSDIDLLSLNVSYLFR